MAHFFAIYKGPEGKIVDVDGWYSREDAWEEIQIAIKRFEDSQDAAKA
ncbi:MAG: inorganic diphosphatase [Baekduiaceae bacterium]